MSLLEDWDGPVAWVLNLDAEHELEGGARYQPTRALREIVRRESARLVGNLVRPGDVMLGADSAGDAQAAGLPGLAWSPTPRALARLEAAGTHVLTHAPAAALARVNERAFAAQVRDEAAEGDGLELGFAKHVATTLEDALARLADPAGEAPHGWLVRRPFGAAGRGRRRIGPGCPSEADHAWLVASLRRGALVLEPFVRVTREFTRSGWVRADGSVLVSQPCLQATTPAGAWLETQAAGDLGVETLSAREDEVLGRTAERVGRALAGEGYHGPFGIDAYRHEHPLRPGVEVLNPLSEINARFTMDWDEALPELRRRVPSK